MSIFIEGTRQRQAAIIGGSVAIEIVTEPSRIKGLQRRLRKLRHPLISW